MNTKIRGFEVVSKYADIKDNIKMPCRSTKGSACYDIFNNTDSDIVIGAGEISQAITTHLKVYMKEDEVLTIYVRSGHGFKYSLKLANSVGILDHDYVDNKGNEGEMFVKFHNQGPTPIIIPKGEAMAQCMFIKYLITDDDTETVGGVRVGGFGSTTK